MTETLNRLQDVVTRKEQELDRLVRILTKKRLIRILRNRLVTPTYARKKIGVSHGQIYNLMDSGEIPWKPVGAKLRKIALIDLMRYMRKTVKGRREK